MTDWRQTRISADSSHHTLDGQPLYTRRFDHVLKFHAPGLAPVSDNDGATHIDLNGEPAYPERYIRTFGFYEGRAAVESSGGWLHILADGQPLSSARYAWCGNFQHGRCTVRDRDGGYFHITGDGLPAYDERWRYAGDYRDGIAVVQRSDGLHTHIDHQGSRVHGRWLIDLDVFHKGFARARDDAGWTHIDTAGTPLYERRFADVEPFYNGQARVARFDGGLEIIDERGQMMHELRSARRSDFAALSRDLVGFWSTEALAAAVQIGVIEAMPGSLPELAERCSARADRLDALLHGLRELDIAYRERKIWHTTRRGRLLRRDHPLTLADAALEYAGPLRELWRPLPEALRGHEWRPPDVFAQVADRPDRIAGHHRMLRSYARHDYPTVAAALQLAGDEVLLDIGGGVGVLAEAILKEYSGVQVVLIDRPEVIALPEVGDLKGPRMQCVAADLFGEWPARGGAAVLARVLHDWDDDKATSILQRVRAAMRSGARVYIIELLRADDGSFGGLCDLHLLMATGGRERTLTGYRRLLDAAGFDFQEVRALAALPSIVVGVAR